MRTIITLTLLVSAMAACRPDCENNLDCAAAEACENTCIPSRNEGGFELRGIRLSTVEGQVELTDGDTFFHIDSERANGNRFSSVEFLGASVSDLNCDADLNGSSPTDIETGTVNVTCTQEGEADESLTFDIHVVVQGLPQLGVSNRVLQGDELTVQTIARLQGEPAQVQEQCRFFGLRTTIDGERFEVVAELFGDTIFEYDERGFSLELVSECEDSIRGLVEVRGRSVNFVVVNQPLEITYREVSESERSFQPLVEEVVVVGEAEYQASWDVSGARWCTLTTYGNAAGAQSCEERFNEDNRDVTTEVCFVDRNTRSFNLDCAFDPLGDRESVSRVAVPLAVQVRIDAVTVESNKDGEIVPTALRTTPGSECTVASGNESFTEGIPIVPKPDGTVETIAIECVVVGTMPSLVTDVALVHWGDLITNQADIEDLNEVEIVAGDLIVSGEANPEFSLPSLREVAGDYRYLDVTSDNSVTHISSTVETIQGNLFLGSDNITKSISFLSLEEVGKSLTIGSDAMNRAVLNEVKLESLHTLGGDLIVQNNPRLNNIDMGSFTNVAGQVSIQAPAISCAELLRLENTIRRNTGSIIFGGTPLRDCKR